MRCLWKNAATLIDRTGSKAPITTAKPLRDVTSTYVTRKINQSNDRFADAREYRYGNALKEIIVFEVSALLFVTLPQPSNSASKTLSRRFEATTRRRTPKEFAEKANERENELAEPTEIGPRKKNPANLLVQTDELLIRAN